MMFDDLVDAGATRAAAKAGTQFAEIILGTGGYDFDIAVFGVADPAAEVEFLGFTMHEPAEADPLHAPTNEEVKHHPGPVLQIGIGGRNPDLESESSCVEACLKVGMQNESVLSHPNGNS